MKHLLDQHTSCASALKGDAVEVLDESAQLGNVAFVLLEPFEEAIDDLLLIVRPLGLTMPRVASISIMAGVVVVVRAMVV
jgi:hypothetical protein